MKTTVIQPHKSSLGMDANLISLIIYIAMALVSWIPYLGWVAWGIPLAVFLMEKESRFVKFQASTALAVGILRAAIAILFQIFIWILMPRSWSGLLSYAYRGWGVWVFLGYASTFIGIAITALIVYLIIMAYGYKQVELPVIGPIAKKASEKLDTINVSQSNPQANQTAGADTASGGEKPVFCGECGAKNESGTKFCGGCGKPLA